MIPEYEEYLTNNQPPAPQGASFNLDPTSGGLHEPTPYYTLNHRQSLPILQTRAAHPEGYESYSASPIDGHPYSSYGLPRNDSMSSSYDIGFRSWSNAAMMPPAPTANAYDQSPGYTFGSISSPSFPTYQVPQQQQHPSQQEGTRLPSVTSDTFSSLNMGHLYTSLPTQTVQNRRLPIPNTTSSCDVPPYPGPDLPEIRPLAEPRTRMNSTHSRIRAPWSSDGGYPSSRNGSTASLAPPNRMSLQPIQSTSMVQEPVVGYHYNAAEAQMTTAQSPSTSPTVAGPSSSSVTYTGGLPYTTAMTPVSYGTYYGLPPITTFQPHDSCNGMNLPQSSSSYSFNPEATTTTTSSSSSDGGHTGVQGTTYASYPTIRHPQPQHAASAEALRRQASFDQQQQHQQHQRSFEGAQRISVERLSGGASGYPES